MNLAESILLLLLIVTAILPFAMILQIANWSHSRYRNKLWNLRDSLVDDLIARNIEFGPGAVKLLDLFETHIRNARRHTFSDLYIAVLLLRKVEIPSITEEMLGSDVRSSDQKILREYFERYRRINFSYLLSSSPSGWFVSLWLALNKLHRHGPDDQPERSAARRKQVVRVELKAMPELAPPSRTHHRGPILDDLPMASVH
jgi:hypothetical protein